MKSVAKQQITATGSGAMGICESLRRSTAGGKSWEYWDGGLQWWLEEPPKFGSRTTGLGATGNGGRHISSREVAVSRGGKTDRGPLNRPAHPP